MGRGWAGGEWKMFYRVLCIKNECSPCVLLDRVRARHFNNTVLYLLQHKDTQLFQVLAER